MAWYLRRKIQPVAILAAWSRRFRIFQNVKKFSQNDLKLTNFKGK